MPRKIKAHQEKQQAVSEGVAELAWVANDEADELARQGAVKNRFSDGDVEVVNKLDLTGAACLNRLMAIHELIMEDEGKEPKKPKGANLRDRVKELHRVGEANGHRTEHRRGLSCLRCLQKSAVKLAHRWVGETCPGTGTENGHTTHEIHGIQVCGECGKWAIPGRKMGPGLGKACNRNPTFHGRRIIRRMIDTHPPLPPYRLNRWPDGHNVEGGEKPKEAETHRGRKRDHPEEEGERRVGEEPQRARIPRRVGRGGRTPAGSSDRTGPREGTGRPPGYDPGGRENGGAGECPGPPSRAVSRLDAVRNRILHRIRGGARSRR